MFKRDDAASGPANYRNLREFIAALEAVGELIRIGEPCSPYLEISAITDLASKSEGGGKALLFERATGYDFPVLTNAFGSRKRINMALGTSDLPALGQRLKSIVQLNPPRSLAEKLAFAREALGWSRFLPRSRKKRSPCQELVYQGDEVDLSRLPVLHTWPMDGGPFVTLPVVFTRSLETKARNVGMYRLQVFDRNSTGMHWHIHKDGAHFFHEYCKAGRRMEVAVVIGCDPAVTYAATAPLPRGIDELLLAGFIRRAPVEMVKCLTVDLEVPAEAEIVLEGYVDPEERRLEGPFGDHTGYYSLADLYPVFHVTALTHRRGAVYSATVVGRPPMEDCYLALATERLFLPLLQTVQPEIKDYWLPWEGVFHNLAVVAIEKTYPRQAWKVMQALWGSGQMSFCKIIVVVDAAADFGDRGSILRLLSAVLDFSRDMNITEGILDVLDHAAPQACYGGKLGIDLTRPLAGEAPRRSPPVVCRFDESLFWLRLREREPAFSGYRFLFGDALHPLLLLAVQKTQVRQFSGLARSFLSLEPPPGTIAIFFDAKEDLEDDSLLLWRLLNNCDPGRDLILEADRLLVDATRKGPEDGYCRQWPEDVAMTPEVMKIALEKAKKWGVV